MDNITLKNIEEIFKGRMPKPIQKFKKAAVMILLEEIEEELFIIFQVRSNRLNHQPGDVCLPGGRIEQWETPKEAAIRETIEELKLKEGDFQVISEMNYFITPYGRIVFPYIAKATLKIENITNEEVDHIFKVPMKFFMENEPKLYKMEIGPINNEKFPYELINMEEYKFSTGILMEYFYNWEQYSIWGITAHIIKDFIDTVKVG